MAMTAVTLLLHRGLAPPASEESEAMPVTVSVRTVVVRSGTASFLTTALRTPIASAIRTINAYVRLEEISALVPALAAKLVARSNKIASISMASFRSRICVQSECRTLIMPPKSAPAMNANSDADDRAAESPVAPPTAKPRSTMLPVILAVNTCPREIKLTASISPVLNVRANNAIIVARLVARTDCTELGFVIITPLPILRGFVLVARLSVAINLMSVDSVIHALPRQKILGRRLSSSSLSKTCTPSTAPNNSDFFQGSVLLRTCPHRKFRNRPGPTSGDLSASESLFQACVQQTGSGCFLLEQ